MFFVIRLAVMSAIMIAYHFTYGVGSTLATFVMAAGAGLAGHGVAYAVKMAVGERPRSGRSLALLTGCVVAVAASVVFVVLDERIIAEQSSVRGLLDLSTMQHSGDTAEMTIVDGGKRIKIRYSGPLSDQVRDRNEIVAKGQWRGDVFIATELFAKCPSTYPSPNGPVPAAQFR